MPNRWVEWVRKWAKDHDTTYGCALSKPECKDEYRAKYGNRKKLPKSKEKELMGMEDFDAPAPAPKKKTKKPKPKKKFVVADEIKERFKMTGEDIQSRQVQQVEKSKSSKVKALMELLKKDEDRKRMVEMSRMMGEDRDAPKPVKKVKKVKKDKVKTKKIFVLKKPEPIILEEEEEVITPAPAPAPKKRGRPKLYATKEEAYKAKLAQNRGYIENKPNIELIKERREQRGMEAEDRNVAEKKAIRQMVSVEVPEKKEASAPVNPRELDYSKSKDYFIDRYGVGYTAIRDRLDNYIIYYYSPLDTRGIERPDGTFLSFSKDEDDLTAQENKFYEPLFSLIRSYYEGGKGKIDEMSAGLKLMNWIHEKMGYKKATAKKAPTKAESPKKKGNSLPSPLQDFSLGDEVLYNVDWKRTQHGEDFPELYIIDNVTAKGVSFFPSIINKRIGFNQNKSGTFEIEFSKEYNSKQRYFQTFKQLSEALERGDFRKIPPNFNYRATGKFDKEQKDRHDAEFERKVAKRRER